MDKKVLVLKVGGSIMYDQLLNINFDLFKRLKLWYYENRDQYSKIVFVTGGGGLSRTMQDRIADNIGGEDYLHSIAMSLTQTNATILASFIEDNDIFVPKTLGNAYEYLVSPEGKTMVSGGLKVGWSTDMDAAIFADILEAGKVYKISNVDYVYTKDPKEYFDAKLIKDMTWKDYFKLFDIVEGEQHKPNHKMPLDVESAQFCARKGISYMISGGKTLEEISSIKKILQTGTFIHP
jgi:predicted uridylate kinase